MLNQSLPIVDKGDRMRFFLQRRVPDGYKKEG